MNTSEGIRIFSDIAYAKSPILVKQTFSNNMVLLNDTLQEMVLLKGLHDAFYSNDFPLQSMLITLDSVSISSPVQTHSEIAQHIKKKVLQARVGFDAPSFELKDTSGVIQSNRSFLSNYVYLNFISLESFACQQELELMKALHTKHKDDLKLVSISIDDDLDKVKAYFKKYNYNWTLLADDSKQSTAAKYKVKAYPTYYLINPEGKLTMSPAPGPGENFEWYFFNILLSKRKGQIR